MAVSSIASTPAQWASASLHLERREDWRFVRIDGKRYAILTSGTSGHTYTVRADAAGCGCPWYVKTGRQCSHMLALDLDALEAELSEPRPAPASRHTTHRPCLRKACGAILPPEWPYRFCDHCWERQRAVLDSISA